MLDRSPMATCLRFQDGTTEGHFTVERQHLTVGSQKLGKPILEELALLPAASRWIPDASS